MGAAKKLEQVEVTKPAMSLAKKISLTVAGLAASFALFTILSIASHWYQSPIRAEFISKVESGKAEKPALYFLL